MFEDEIYGDDHGYADTATLEAPEGFVWARVREALDHGFYLETLSLFECVIRDALLDVLASRNVGLKRKSPGLAHLVRRARKAKVGVSVRIEHHESMTDPMATGVIESRDLLASIDAWRRSRDALLDRVATLTPDAMMEAEAGFVDRAMLVAQEGEKLARLARAWAESAG